MKRFSSRKMLKYGIKVVTSSDNDNMLSNVIGHTSIKEELSNTIRLLKEFYNPNSSVMPYTRFILLGPPGTGKATTVFGFAKDADLPIVVIDANSLVDKKMRSSILKYYFKILNSFPKAVALIKDFEYCNNSSSEKLENDYIVFCRNLLHKILYSNAIVFLTLSATCGLPSFMLEEGAFERVFNFELPTIEFRKDLIVKLLNNVSLDSSVTVDKIAKNTFGMTGGTIKKVIKRVLINAELNKKHTLSLRDFDDVISEINAGEKTHKMTEKERLATAYHEAGHVVASYYSNPEYKLSKVEIAARTESLGLTAQEIDENKHSMFKKDFENHIICCLGGYVAERFIYGENTSGVSQDLFIATSCADSMVALFGMCDNVGPICIDEDAMTISEDILAFATSEVHHILKFFLKKTEAIIGNHMASLEALARALVQKETVYGNEIKEIFENAEKRL